MQSNLRKFRRLKSRPTNLFVFAALCSLIFLASTTTLYAKPKASSQKRLLAEALSFYKKGQYNDTFKILNRIAGNRNIQATVRYWKGLVRFKQQKFDKAIINFSRAKKLGATAKDLNYQLGQSYYAAQKLEPAIKAFTDSAKISKYKISASAYYIGYIHQLRDENKAALSYYERISRMNEDPDKVKQPALYQIAEIKFDQIKGIKDKNKRANLLHRDVLPLYENAYDLAEESSAGKESKARIDYIEKEFRRFRRTGKKKSNWKFKFENDIRYDSNVITRADDAVVSVAGESSMVNKFTARAAYSRKLSNRWSLSSNIKGSAKIYTERSTPEIYKNDTAVLSFGISASAKNDLLADNSLHTFGYDFNHTLQDHTRTHSLDYFSKTHSVYFQETLRLWNAGPTKLKITWKFFGNHIPTSENFQFQFYGNQKIKLGKKLNLSTTLQTTWLFGKTTNSDTIRYELNNRLPIPLEDTDLTIIPYLGLSFLDTKEQRAARGWEKKVNASVTGRLNINRESRYIVKLGYDFTRNFSQDTNNQQFTRHEVFLSGAYRF